MALLLKIAALYAALLPVIGACASRSGNAPAPPVPTPQTFEDQGRDHIPQGFSPPIYNSNPPTSVMHSPNFVDWGVYTDRMPPEVMVHNMEHGGVIVWHNCDAPPKLSAADCKRLTDDLARVVRAQVAAKKEVVMVPYPAMDRRIALTAWTKLLFLDSFDEQQVRGFIQRYDRAYNPEGF